MKKILFILLLLPVIVLSQSQDQNYIKTVFEVIPIGNNKEKKIKKFVLTKKGLDKLISEL